MLKHSPKLYLLIVFSLCAFLLNAQKWEKSFNKLDALNEYGDYLKAKKGIVKLEKKIIKKLGSNSTILASALIRKAKYNEGLGLLNEIEETIEQAITLSTEVNEENPSEHGYLLKEAAKVLVDYGNYRIAGDYVTSSREVLTSSGNMIEDFEIELDILDAQILIGKGYFRQAIEMVDDRTPFFEQKVSSASKKEEKPRRDLGKLLIVKADALRKMGNYISSDSAFVYNEDWLSDNLGKTDVLYAQNQFLNTQLLEENGLEVDAQARQYEGIYLKAIRKYANSHKTIMLIRESLMKAYFENSNKSKLKLVQSEFKKTLVKSFPKTSVHTLADDLIRLNYRFINENLGPLEDRVNRLISMEIIPENHQFRIDLIEFANEIALLKGAHKNTESYQNEILSIKEYLYGSASPSYHLSKTKLANYYIDYTDKYAEAEEIYEVSFGQIVNPEITEGHIDYLGILNHMASFYQETDDYSKAGKILDEALLVSRRKYDNRDISYAEELNKIARLQIQIGQYEKAEKNLATAFSIFKDNKTDKGKTATAVALITEATLFGIKGEYDEAEKNINQSERLLSQGALSAETAYGVEDNLAPLYIKIGRLSDAKAILTRLITEKTNLFGPTSRQLNQPLTLQSELLLTEGDYTEAERLARRANNLSKDIFDEESSKLVPSMIRLAEVYSTIGDYDKAESLLTNAIAIQRLHFGREHVDVAKSMSTLALVKFYKDEPEDEVLALFGQSEKIIGKKLGASNPTYAEVLKNLAIVNIAGGQYSIAFTYLDDAGRIWDAKIGRRNNINAATINVLKGDIYYRQKQYAKAENFYERAKKQFEKFFNDSHPEFVRVQSKLAKTYYMQGNWKKSQDQMESVLGNYQNFIGEYFPALSEREKAKFWNTIKSDYEFYNTLIVSKNSNGKYLGELFDNALLTKALLLNSSIKIRRRIAGSTDEELKKVYASWIDKKELLTAALSMSTQQLEDNDIKTSSLNNDVEQLEKELSLKSEIFGQEMDSKRITWGDIQNSLGENEIAIEMVRFRHFDHVFSDSILYALLYVTAEEKSEPRMILLKNGEELENKYLKYYRNTIKFKLKDNFSYQQFWEPIIEEVGTVSTLYISPDGVYNQINLESIPTPDERYVLDNSNIILLSNTKDLYYNRVRTRVTTDKQVAMMFGNPTFYVDTTPGNPNANSGLTRATAEVVSDLPGTKKEINELQEYLGDRGWEIDSYTELEASEPSIKKVSNPRIFHVATHGFFQSGTQAEANLDDELKANNAYENPLLKSGLLLTGAGDILNETKYNYNVDNGILTAYEAMNLNLDQTDLVVLSACETGLGEMEAGEGVYGLQRAFLVAGAKTIIMSLFKVSDEATQLLMVKFYRKWIETGDKRTAFIDAKKEIRNEFGDPIYWSPFIMIGLD